jgi:hypothetical protein
MLPMRAQSTLLRPAHLVPSARDRLSAAFDSWILSLIFPVWSPELYIRNLRESDGIHRCIHWYMQIRRHYRGMHASVGIHSSVALACPGQSR